MNAKSGGGSSAVDSPFATPVYAMVWELQHTLVGLTNPVIFLHLLTKQVEIDPGDAASRTEHTRTGVHATRAAQPGWPGAGRLDAAACALLRDDQVVGSYEMHHGAQYRDVAMEITWNALNDGANLVPHEYKRVIGSDECRCDMYVTRRSGWYHAMLMKLA